MKTSQKILMNQNKETIFYDVETYTSVQTLEETRENTVESTISKRFIEKNKFGNLYVVNFLQRNQSYNEGISKVEDYLMRFQKKLLIYTNDIGSIISIPNIREIRELWDDSKIEFRKRFKNIHGLQNIIERIDYLFISEKGFLQVFAQSEIGTLLFPGIYSDKLQEDKALIQHKFFQNFLGPYPLPILLETKIIDSSDNKNKIARTGSIQWQFFEEDKIKSFFREILKDYPYINEFDAFYSELYDLDSEYCMTNALQLLYVKVGNVYSVDSKTTIAIQKK
ncbi:hypothetical protein [uncultured Aquimarina sp.]|uniref:hypothetical protein n=1 Tax=uncultured Aquimarina sp. TaxID=575652 RepID=UPI0026150640|nr:hypothetical protein [uncultured Aquimarina sp.]